MALTAQTHDLLGDLLPGRLVVEATADYVRDAIGCDSRAGERRWRTRASAVHRGRVVDTTQLLISPGSLRVRTRKAAQYETNDATYRPRIVQGHLLEDAERAEVAASMLAVTGELRDRSPRSGIAEWSRRSRSRFFESMTQIDADSWAGVGRLAMVTLTLPGDWLTVAPTGGEFKRLVRVLRHRWAREVGPWQAVWKLEFQRRGAPHMHLLMQVPARSKSGRPIREWLSSTWAEIVAHPDPDEYAKHLRAGVNIDYGFKGTDPKRIAVYFLKHGAKTTDSKEYQHAVPEAWRAPGAGPGRFWGIAGLQRVVIPVELDAETFYRVRRILRGVHRGARARAALQRRAVVMQGLTIESARRATLLDLRVFGLRRSRVLAGHMVGGWVAVNDAPALAHQLARYLGASAPPV